MTDRGRLSGRIALVTGAAQGIGEAIARRFAAEGARVVATDIQRDRGEHVAAELGDGASFETLDVCDPAAWEVAVARIVARHGGLDILVNNAGGAAAGAIEQESIEDHRRIVALNVTGVWSGIRAVIPAMRERGGGSIVNISSIDGLVGVSGLSTYVATKFAVTGLTRSLALELGVDGIRVNSVHPGIIASTLVRAAAPRIMARLEKAVATQPIRRMGTPEEIAAAVLFFASDESAYCTGSALVVDGGHLAGPYRDPL